MPRDTLTHIEKSPMPGFTNARVRDFVAQHTGLVGNMPKTVGTGCGKRRTIVQCSTIPENVTCPGCRDYARSEHTMWADMCARAAELPNVPGAQRQAIRDEGNEHRRMAKRFG